MPREFRRNVIDGVGVTEFIVVVTPSPAHESQEKLYHWLFTLVMRTSNLGKYDAQIGIKH
jgi:hypothetical protein